MRDAAPADRGRRVDACDWGWANVVAWPPPVLVELQVAIDLPTAHVAAEGIPLLRLRFG